MKLFTNLKYLAALVAAIVAWFGLAGQARAVFTLSGTAAELVSRGINADFEAPAQARGAGEATSTNNIGPGWTFYFISGISNNYGVQDPADGFYGAPPLPAPYEQFQIGFFNLNNPFSQAELVSNPIGLLRAAETYTLNVAVGARLTTTQNQVAYRVGMRASDGTDLGTFATTVVVPSGAAGTITNLQYTLDMNTVSSYVGDDVRIVIGGYNTSLNASGTYAVQLAQPNFDNVRLAGTFDDLIVPPSLTASVLINRQTGAISLNNTSASNLNIAGYTLTSTNGAFDQASWSSIANTYDQPSSPTPGNGSVDSDDPWTILSASGSKTDLSEEELSGGNGGTLSTSTPINLGNAWRRTPFQDVQAQVLLGDGSSISAAVQYTGSAIPSGDLNGDSFITGSDWTLFKAGQGTNFTGMTKAEAYLKGDLTGDLKHDLSDFSAFRTAYLLSNPGASFADLVAGVPEPSSATLLIAASLLFFNRLRQRNRHLGIFVMNQSFPMRVAVMTAAGAILLAHRPACAQTTTVAHWTFDTGNITTGANGILTAADVKAGVHNAATQFNGTGGAGGPQINSVTGAFGQAAEFTNNNTNGATQANYAWMNFPQLTEIAGPSAGDFAFAAWAKVPVQNPTWDSNTIIADWGNAPANTHRFTYWFSLANVDANVELRPRAQIRAANAPPDPATVDIIATTLSAPQSGNVTTFDDDAWHHFVWSWNKTAGQMNYYIDGALRHTQTSTQAGANLNLLASDSTVGALGAKRDNNRYFRGSMDEVYVFNGQLNAQQVTDLYTLNLAPDGTVLTLTLRVDPATGQAQIQNNSTEAIALSSYRIASVGNALNPSGWDPIATGTPISGFPQGNGTGNGWEIPPGGGIVAGDYNNNGKVDGADYVVWRKTNINGAAGYTTWRSNFGATGSGGNGGDPNELVEWYLTGESTLALGSNIALGQAFNIGGNQDLLFQFTTSTGVKAGIVEYGAIGAGTGASAIPEPSAGWLMLIGCGLAIVIWRRRTAPHPAMARAAVVFVVTSAAAGTALATVTNDRIYRFGENGVAPQTQENGVAGQAVGSGVGNPLPGTTLDHIGPSGSFQSLLAGANAGGALPIYQNLSTVGTGRSGLGILFDGTDDFLNGFSLGFPPLSRGTINGGGSGTLNYNGVYQRGYQLWVYPHAGATVEQHVVSDTTEHGVRISTAGNWILRHAGTNVTTTVPATVNQWAHVMATMPDNSQPHKGVLYVNGVALAVQAENYDTTSTVNLQALIVGANTDANGTLVGTTNFFRGVLDELEMFIWGRGYNHLTDTYRDFGTFNFATDNSYAATHLTGVPGDINSSGGAPNQADVDAFVAGWLFEKRVNNVRVGDLATFAKGDLNFDGITNVTDMALFRDALGSPGSGAGLDLTAFNSLGVPEPSSIALALILFGLWGSCRRHGRTSA